MTSHYRCAVRGSSFSSVRIASHYVSIETPVIVRFVLATPRESHSRGDFPAVHFYGTVLVTEAALALTRENVGFLTSHDDCVPRYAPDGGAVEA